MDSFSRLHEDSNKIGIEFLLTEIESAFTFLALAQGTVSAETRERNRRHALEAYKVVLRMQSKVTMEPQQNVIFQQKFSLLKSRLEELGLDIS